MSVEEVECFLDVEFSPLLGFKRCQDHVEACSRRLRHPLLERRLLYPVCRPLGPLGLRLHHLQLVVFPHRDSGVSCRAPHRPSQHGVEAIQPDDSQEIARVHFCLVQLYHPSRPRLHLVEASLGVQEFEVALGSEARNRLSRVRQEHDSGF